MIRRTRDDRLDAIEAGAEQTRTDAAAPTRPERAHLTALTAELLTRLDGAILDWTDWAEARVESWDDLGPSDERTAEAGASLADIVRRTRRRLRRHRPGPSDRRGPGTRLDQPL